MNFYTACYEKSCRYCDNTWMNILQKISFNQVIFYLCFWYYSWRNWVKNYISALIIKLWMQSWFEINIWFFWFKKYWINFQKHDISQSLTSFICLIKFIYTKMMRSILHFKQDENCLNNLWYFLVWKMNSVCFNITLITYYMNFLMYLSQHILMISWFTQISCLSIKNTYN